MLVINQIWKLALHQFHCAFIMHCQFCEMTRQIPWSLKKYITPDFKWFQTSYANSFLIGNNWSHFTFSILFRRLWFHRKIYVKIFTNDIYVHVLFNTTASYNTCILLTKSHAYRYWQEQCMNINMAILLDGRCL